MLEFRFKILFSYMNVMYAIWTAYRHYNSVAYRDDDINLNRCDVPFSHLCYVLKYVFQKL